VADVPSPDAREAREARGVAGEHLLGRGVEGAGEQGEHEAANVWLLKAEAVLESDTHELFEGQPGILRSALRLALPRLPVVVAQHVASLPSDEGLDVFEPVAIET
jgi:hypothetical protein